MFIPEPLPALPGVIAIMQMSAARRVGIAMIPSGVVLYDGMKYWVESRNFVPVNISISLQKGASVKQKFSVNLSGGYWLT